MKTKKQEDGKTETTANNTEGALTTLAQNLGKQPELQGHPKHQ